MDSLKKFCETIRLRRENADFTIVKCIFCESNFKGYDALQSHIFDDHHIVLPPFDDIEDIDGFLALIKSLCRDTASNTYKCLSSGQVFNSLSELETHLKTSAVAGATIAAPDDRKSDHRFWTWDIVPQLAPFRYFTPDAHNAEEDAEEEAMNNAAAGAFIPLGDDELAAEGTRVIEEGCASSRIECPYCVSHSGSTAASRARYDNDDFTAHLLNAHRIPNFTKMLKAFRPEGSAAEPDFHEQIRLLNMLREKTDNGLTPYTNVSVEDEAVGDNSSAMASVLLQEAAAFGDNGQLSPSQLAQVYLVSPLEYPKLLSAAPTEDYYLLPRRPNDSLITYVLHTDEDDEEEENEEAYPMVPTLQECAATRNEAAEDESD